MYFSSLNPSTVDDAPLGLHGWAWQGTDLLLNSAPYPLSAGLDGCYLLAHRDDAGALHLGVDSRGLTKLFVYQDGGTWAVADSYAGLMDNLRAEGINPPLDERTARNLSTRGVVFQQLTTSHTLSRGVRLLPSDAAVVIDGPHLTVRRPPRPAGSTGRPYASALREFLNVWSGRFRTLVEAGSHFHIDVSGGTDSRVVLAFALANGLKELPDERVNIVSSTAKKDDWRAASLLSAEFGFPLNKPLPASWPHAAAGPAHAVAQWRAEFLGVHFPLINNPSYPSPSLVQLHGAGGEILKHEFRALLWLQAAYHARHMGPRAGGRWLGDLRKDLGGIGRLRPTEPLGDVHYREFRNRFHFGHRPHARLMYLPLESALCTPLAAGKVGRHRLQTHYDIMESLVPGIAGVDFDAPSKNLTPRRAAALTRVEWQAQPAGKIYAGKVNVKKEHTGGRSFNRTVVDALARALNCPSVQVLPPRTRALAQQMLEADGRANANSELALASSQVIAVAFAAGELEK